MTRGVTVEEIMQKGTVVSSPDVLILPTYQTLYILRNNPDFTFLAIVELVDCDYGSESGPCFVTISEILKNIGKGGGLPFEVRVGQEINTPLGDLYLM